ncbi:hypothetical protein L484_022709 [Morus notabilis]|uniref:Uncharacterized protein n=1 Tax=Morus notabilis TaxID=981085 RepID=W9SMJ6_9ROSA|nr:hypothetical protein L484_022709 [Morus notabilis]
MVQKTGSDGSNGGAGVVILGREAADQGAGHRDCAVVEVSKVENTAGNKLPTNRDNGDQKKKGYGVAVLVQY